MLYSSSHEYSSDDVDIRRALRRIVRTAKFHPNFNFGIIILLHSRNSQVIKLVVHISDGMHDNTEVV